MHKGPEACNKHAHTFVLLCPPLNRMAYLGVSTENAPYKNELGIKVESVITKENLEVSVKR